MTALELSKAAIDVGIQTNRWADHETFWSDEIGLRYDHLLKVGGGVHQHRYDLPHRAAPGGVLKVNSHRDPLPADSPTGFVGMAIIRPDGCTAPHPAETPDGTPVHLVDPHGGEVTTIVRLEATDAADTVRAWTDGLGADVVEPGSDRPSDQLGGQPSDQPGIRIGESVVEVVEVPDRAPTRQRDGVGIRYLTVQVRDVRAAHAHALAAGLREGLAPVRLGDTAFISFVRLPDGDWIELSQRASLTGPLPDDAPRA